MKRPIMVHPALQGQTLPPQNPPVQTPANPPPPISQGQNSAAPQNPPLGGTQYPVQAPAKPAVPDSNAEKKPKAQDDSLRKFPRPLISQAASKEQIRHDTKNLYHEVPSLFYDFQAKDEGNAPCKFARSSIYLIPENSSVLNKSGVPFAITFCPLAEQHPKDSAVPVGDKRQTFVLRCERCGTFANSFFSYKEHWEKYVCNVCDLESSIDPKYLDKQTYSYELFPETVYSVCDIMVPDSYKLTEVVGHCVLVCLDFSLEGLTNGAYYHCLSSIKTTLDSADEDTSFGFVFWDSTVSFFKFNEDCSDVFISRSADPTNPVAGLSPSDVFFNVKTQRETINKIIDFFENYAENQYKNHINEVKNTPHSLEQLALVINDFFSNQAGHVLIFTSTHKNKPNEQVKYPAIDKNPPLKPKIPFFTHIGEQLAQKCVTVDMFITSDQQMELSTISDLCCKTGGTLYYYPRFKIANHSEKFFYDVFRAITAPRVFDVAMRLRCSQGFHVMDYLTPKGQVFSLDFQLPSITADQFVIANLQMLENVKDRKKVFFQAACLYTTASRQRFIRTINFYLQTTTDIPLFFKQLDCDALSFAFFRNMAFKLKNSLPVEVQDEFMKAIEKLFKYYRFDVGGKYESREFALPDKLKYFPLYISAFLNRPSINTKNQLDPDSTFYSCVEILQTPIIKLLFMLYPKIFDLDKLYKETSDDNTLKGISGTKVDDLTVLPDSIPSNKLVMKSDGAYLIDNGEFFYLYIAKLVSSEILNELFGVQDLSEGTVNLTLQNFEQSDFNQRVQAIIERLKAIKGGSVQPVMIITDGDENFYRLRSCFVEDLNSNYANNYWDFLSLLHDRVKDE